MSETDWVPTRERVLLERIAELEAAVAALIEIIDGPPGIVHGVWVDDHGFRLKDIPEYVALYLAARKSENERLRAFRDAFKERDSVG